MTIRSKESDKNSEDVQKHSYEPKDDRRYEAANKEDREKLIDKSWKFLNLTIISDK